MHNGKWQPFIWSGLYIILLLSIAIPLLNAVTMFLIMVPVFVLFMKLKLRSFIVTMAAVMLVVWALLGGFGLVLNVLSLFFMPPVLIMGTLYQRGSSAKQGIITGILTLIGEQLLLLLAGYAAGLDPIGSYRTYMNTMADDIKAYVHIDPEVFTRSIELVIQMIPLMMVTVSVLLITATHGAGRWIVRRYGGKVPGLPPLRHWRLQKSIIFYYVVFIVLDQILNINSDSIWVTVTLNVLPVLTVAFLVQSLSFLQFVVHVKKWSRFLPLLAVLLMILFFPSIFAFTLLGMADTAFPIRDRMSGSGK